MKKLILALILPINAVCAVTIHDAVKEGGYETVKTLLNNDSDLVNAQDSLKRTPLHIVAECGKSHSDMAHFLIENGAKSDILDQDGWSPLHVAIWYSNLPVSQVLIESGANINAYDPEYRNTPLHKAMQRCNLESVKLLVKYGANIHAKNQSGNIPIDAIKKPGEEQATSFLKDFTKDLANFLEKPLQKPSKYIVLEHIYHGLLDKSHQECLVNIGKKYSVESKFSDFHELFKDLYNNDSNVNRRNTHNVIKQQINCMAMYSKRKMFDMEFRFE